MTSPNWFIDLRAQSHGGPVGTLKITDGNGQLFDTATLVEKVRGQDVLLMTHGFENNRQQGTDALNEWKSHLQIDPPPFFIGVLWPGDGFLPIFIDYIWEGSEAEKSGTVLGQFVDANFGAAASVSFGSHSLGVRVMMQAISQLNNIQKARHLITLAAAIEDDTLNKEFQGVAGKVKHISVIYSMQDHVLALAYPSGNLVGGVIERGNPNVKAALGRSGPASPAPASVIGNPRLPDTWSYGHTDYTSTDHVDGDFPPTVNIPSPDTPAWGLTAPAPIPNPPALTATDKWKPCWSADYISTRWPLS